MGTDTAFEDLKRARGESLMADIKTETAARVLISDNMHNYEEPKSGGMHCLKDKLLNFVKIGGSKEPNVNSYELLEEFLQFSSADWYSFVVSNEDALISHCEKVGLIFFSTVLYSFHSNIIDVCF